MLDRTSYDFGSVMAGWTSMAHFEVMNIGQARTGTIEVATTGEAFHSTDSCTSSQLSPGQRCTVDVFFMPVAEGRQGGALRVTASPGGAATAALSGMATPSTHPVALGATPDQIGFPCTPIGGTSDARLVSIRNEGGVPASKLSVVARGDFASTTNCPDVLNAAQSCTASVTFTPKSRGRRTGTLIISGGGETLTVSLGGIGDPAPGLVISPMAAAFTGFVGQPSSPVKFTVANTSNVTSGTPVLSLGGANAAGFRIDANECLTPLPASSNCTFDVVFTRPPIGTRSAIVTVTATPGGITFATLNGEAVNPGGLLVSPSALDFGDVSDVGVNAMSAGKKSALIVVNGAAGEQVTVQATAVAH